LDFINIILEIILIILFIIFLVLFFGIRISLNLNKKKSEISGILKIIIFEKIAIIKQEFPPTEGSKEDEKPSKLKGIFNKIINRFSKKEEVEEEKEDSDLKKQLESIKPLIPNIKKIIPRFVYFLKKTLNSFEIKKFYIHTDFGISNYADTAKFVGYYWAFATIPNTIFKSCSITARPIFIEETFDLDVDIDIKIKLLTMTLQTSKLILNKDMFDLIKNLIKIYRENND